MFSSILAPDKLTLNSGNGSAPTKSSQKRILFFTRGRGRGHAIPDIQIVEELGKLSQPTEVQFVSYGTGAATLRESGCHVIDLGFSDDNNFFDTLVAAQKCICEFSPDLVVSHEEFAAVPAAHMHGARVVFITDWFLDGSDMFMQSIRYSEQVLFIGRRGIFPEPDYLKGRVHYVGDIVRPFAYGLSDRAKARERLDLEEDCLVVSVIPGRWANEKRAPLFELVLSAVKDIPRSRKRLIWIAGSDYNTILSHAWKHRFLKVYPHYDPIEAVMVASDVVITKANRGTTIETDELGVPSISLSFGSNFIDDLIISQLKNNLALNARAVDGQYLRDAICMRAAQSRSNERERPPAQSNANARRAAELLVDALPVMKVAS